MTRKEVREFIEAGVNMLVPVPEFGSGLITDFNYLAQKSPDEPKVWQVVSPVGTVEGTAAPTDSWSIELIVAKFIKMDDLPNDYEPVIDECDDIARKLWYKLRTVVDGYKLVTMEGTEREPFVKKNAGCFAGVYLRFTLVSQNTSTDVC